MQRYTVKQLTEEEYNHALAKSQQRFPIQTTKTTAKRGAERDLAELSVDIFTVAEDSTVTDRDGHSICVSRGEKVKVLNADQYEDADWVYCAAQVSVNVVGVAVGLKPGTRLAVLPLDYKEQLKAHEAEKH